MTVKTLGSFILIQPDQWSFFFMVCSLTKKMLVIIPSFLLQTFTKLKIKKVPERKIRPGN